MAFDLQSMLAGGYPSGGMLSGDDPTAPLQLQALQQNNIASAAANPANYSSQGIFGGLARELALSGGMSGANDALTQIAQQKIAAQPDLAAALAAPQGPLNYAAQNPGMNPVARAPLLNIGTQQATETQTNALRNWALVNQFGGLKIPGLGSPALPGYTGPAPGAGSAVPGSGPVVTPSTAAAPSGATPAPGTLPNPAVSPYASGGRYDPIQATASYLARLSPAARQQALLRLQALQGMTTGNPVAAAPSGPIAVGG
jgi:hypothetical protein